MGNIVTPTEPTLTYRTAKMFGYEGVPFRLCGNVFQRYRTFLPLYKDELHVPRYRVLMTARQVAKSTNLAALAYVYSILVERFRTLIALPMQDQAKNFVAERLHAFRSDSPLLQEMLSGKESKDTWNRKILNNTSRISIEWILNNPMRARGGTYDLIGFDECQDMDEDSLPIVTSCLKASSYRLQWFSGTPYSENNLLAKKFTDSSAAEWVSPCEGCNYDNVASVEEDLLQMIGDNGPICAKCSKPLDTDTPKCHFEHKNPELRTVMEGYHIPQVILPMHYAGKYGKLNWDELIANRKDWSDAKFYNEILGSPKDAGGVLITKKEIKKQCTLDLPSVAKTKRYVQNERHTPIIMAIDWGGKGVADTSNSKTAITVMGLRKGSGITIDTLHTEDFDVSTPVEDEFKQIDYVYRTFQPKLVYHDQLASSIHRYTVSKITSIPQSQIYGIETGVNPSRKVFELVKKPQQKPYYWIDKTRGILMFFQGIKNGYINFDDWERFQYHADSYMSVTGEESTSKKRAGNLLLIATKAGMSNDILISSTFCFLGLIRLIGKMEIFTDSAY